MTTDEILAGIDQSLAAITTERERLLHARAELAGDHHAPSPRSARPRVRRRRGRSQQGSTLKTVLEALDPSEARTAGDIEKITNLGRAVAGSTLTRLVKQGQATKAERGYLRAA